MIGQKLNDRYEVLSELGRGGMGIVYLAKDPMLDREVAIKLVSPNLLNEAMEERLQREARVVASMDHPVITPVYDIGRHEGCLFFVMPVVRGTNLRNLIRAGAVDLGDVLEIGIQVARALEYSHTRGVLHRDIKPDNIMVSRDASGGVGVRVMDFGLARRNVETRLTTTGALVGTIRYISPEQVARRDIDHRSDIYSLGAVLYECLAGAPPFSGELHAVLHQIVYEDPMPLSTAKFFVDTELEDLVLECLSKDSKKRPQSAVELAQRLAHYRDSLNEHELKSTLVAPKLGRHSPSSLDIPLIGRKKELALLQESLDRSVSGECQFVLIGGEEGVGKGRLLEEFETHQIPDEIRVLHGRFVEQQSGFPLHGFCELIQHYFRSKELNEGSPGMPDFSDLAGELVAVFPVLGEIQTLRTQAVRPLPYETPELNAGDKKTYSFELIARTLTRISNNRPLVIILEDLHLGDVALTALQYVIRRLGPTSTFVLGTYCSEAMSQTAPVARLLESFRGDRHFTSIHLPPLTKSEHGSLLSSLLGGLEIEPELAHRVYETTDGNPFFTIDLIQSLQDFGVLAQNEHGSWYMPEEQDISSTELPRTIQQAVDKRIRNLSPELQGLLRIASILGKNFKFEHLEALCPDDTDVDEAVDALLDAGVLSEVRQSREERLAFASGAVRDVLYASLTRRKRRLHHRRFAEFLESSHSDHIERISPLLSHHFTQGDSPDKAITYGLLAARQALERFSPDEAFRALKNVLSFLEEGDRLDEDHAEGEAWLLLGRAERMKGNADAALGATEKAVEIYRREGDDDHLVETMLLAAEICWESRQINWAERWVDRGLEASRKLEESEWPQKLLSLGATLANLRGDYDRARQYEEMGKQWSADEPVQRELPRGGRLVVALTNQVHERHPSQALMVEEIEVYATVFETLIETDARGNLQPLLCESWERAGDGKSFTFTIREGVQFHDGHLLTAHDVKYCFEGVAAASADSAASGAVRTVLESLVQEPNTAEKKSSVPGLVVLSDRQFRFDLAEPLSIFPALLTQPQTAISREVIEPGQAESVLQGTGPFRLSSFEPERIILERNENYWRGMPARLDGIEFRTGLSSAATVERLRSGSLDIAHDLLPMDLEKVLRDPRLRSRLVEMPEKNTFFLLFNAAGPVASNHALREVMTRTLRVPDLVWRTLGRFAQPATGLIPPGVIGHHPGRRFSEPISAEDAQEIMAAESISRPVYIRAAVHPALLDRYRALFDAILSVWRELSIEVSVVNKDAESFVQRWDDIDDVDLWIGRWVADYADADNFTYGLFHSKIGLLRHYFHSDEIDALAQQARTEQDPSVRHGLYLKIERTLRKEEVILPLFHDFAYRLANPQVNALKLRSSPPYVNYHELAKSDETFETTSRELTREVLEIPCIGGLRSLDPALARSLTEYEAISNVFERLTRVTEVARVEPWLAKHIEPQDDSRSYRVTLRNNVHFHSGRLLTSRDVRYSFERLLRIGGHRGEIMTCIRGADAVIQGKVAELEGFHLKSLTEFVIELEKPNHLFPLLLSHPTCGIVPEASRATGRESLGYLPGTGPFKIAQFVAGHRLELEASPEYWRPGHPKSSGLLFQLNVPQKEIASQFRTGRFAVATRMDEASVEDLRSDSGFARGFRESPGLSTAMLQFNTLQGPMADEGFRRLAISAVDAASVVRRAVPGLVTPAQTLVPPALLTHKSSVGGIGPTIRKPEALSDRMTIKAAVLPTPTYFPLVAREIFRSLGKLGIRVHTVNETVSEFFGALEAGEIDLVVGRWCAHYPDADSFYHQLYDSKSGYLRKLYCSETLDHMVDQSRSESDPFLRQTLYLEIEALLARRSIVLPLFHEPETHFVRTGIRGFRSSFGYPTIAYETLWQQEQRLESKRMGRA